MRLRFFPLIIAALSPLAALPAAGQASSLTNPTKHAYKDELVRLMTPAPTAAGAFVVKEDGTPVPYQRETLDGKEWVWVCSDFDPGATHNYRIEPGRPAFAKPKVRLTKEGADYVLDNGITAVKVPAALGTGTPGPVTAIHLDGPWVGGSAWHTDLPLRKFAATVVGDGTLFAKVRLRYDFDAKAGLDNNAPAFAEVDVTLGPGWNHAQIAERHEMGRGDFWEFDASRGWSPTRGISHPFSSGPGSGQVGGKIEPDRELKPNGLPYEQPDFFINLFPRWNQSYKDGWSFAATDGKAYVGAVVVRASQWFWPHDNSIQCLVHDTGTFAGLRGSTWHGRRLWWLFAGPALVPADVAYVARYAWEGLDKLNHEFILDWPGVTKGSFAGMNFYDGGQMNPTGGLRGAGRRAITDAGKTGDLSTLARVQVMMHPDAYGSLYDHWSPENPNFFTDFTKLPIALTAQLRTHPRFEELREAAEAKLREDMDHSIALPGGAGQECPGYVGYALKNWTEIAPVCRQYLGFDPTTWPRYKAAEHFQKRIAYPDGDTRRQLPMGDTHPTKDDGPAKVDVPAGEVAKYGAEELPGFGVIFNHNPGTARETYIAFKAGPNRGHYHGDQLSVHLCFDARPVAVDHHCSYHPRAGQEHMHNRLAFGTDEMPYANMDGYERLIAFKTSPAVDVAVGQVESDRLRECAKLPPEIWDQRYPQHRFARPLVYRRTVVFMKGQGGGAKDTKDYLVIRDQFRASEPVRATYCLHVLSDTIKREGPRVDWGNLTFHCAEPAAFEFEAFAWTHDNGGHEATQGARLAIKADHGQFITVLYPGKLPAVQSVPGGVRVGEDEVTFAGTEPAANGRGPCVTVKRGGKEALSLTNQEIDLDRSQGDIGLFVPDAGYPFGDIPDWLIRQRANRPAAPHGETP